MNSPSDQYHKQKQKSRQSRIPYTLQAVFLASNRGNEVHKPPPEKVANKTFFGNWFFQRNGVTNKKNKNKNKRSSFRFQLSSRNLKSKRTAEEETETSSVSHEETKPKCAQEYLDDMLMSRGYPTHRYETLNTAYYNKPTPLQQASYDVHLIGIVRRNDVDKFARVMSSGLSPNPCNRYGESLVHMICRRGNHELLKVLIANGCSLQVADDYGRTPLHDACWAKDPCFEVIKLILSEDARLLHMVDARGHAPLHYVREEHYEAWIQFFEENKDVYWPLVNQQQQGVLQHMPPPLTLRPINGLPLPDPVRALTLELANMVASGRMEPEEARFLSHDNTTSVNLDMTEWSSDEEDVVEFESDDESYVSSLDDESDLDDDESDSSSMNSDDLFDEQEMAELLASLPSMRFSTSSPAIACG